MKIAVIGSGTMGASIAAHIASCGHQVLLLDLASSPVRNALAEKAIERIKASIPPLISHPKRLANIQIGNLNDDISSLANCDLVIEAVLEDLQVKLALFKKIAKFLQPDCFIASNTSTLSLKLLKSQNIWDKTIIIHFFNPVRYLQLIELVADAEHPKIQAISDFLCHDLGKTVIRCNDSPGFIANRVGCFFLELALLKAVEVNLNIAEIDHFACRVLGMPKTGIFGLYDLIGIDVMRLIGMSLINSLADDDAYKAIHQNNVIIDELVSAGSLGLKSKCGFYKKQDGVKLALDLRTMQYSSIKASDDVANNTVYIDYFRSILQQTYVYAFALVPGVVNSIEKIDEAMKLGYNWQFGPSQLLNVLDYRPAVIKMSKPVGNAIISNNDACLYAYKDSLVFSINTKLNILTSDVFHLLDSSLEAAANSNKRLIIYNSSKNFSAGGDLAFFLSRARQKDFKSIEDYITLGQGVMQKVKYSAVPVVSVAQNIALGGGCELLLQSNFVVSSLELQAGLVEVGVGLVPAWGGLKEMILRGYKDPNLLLRLLNNILHQNRTSSADYFQEDYSTQVRIVANPADLLDYAVNLDLQNWQRPKVLESINLPNISLLEQDLSKFDEHTLLTVHQISAIFSQNQISERQLLQREREIFMILISQEAAIAKISKIFRI